METERTFLVSELPRSIKTGKGTSIAQGYLSIEEASEVRVRRAGKKFFLTAKQGTGLQREENEVSITRSQFEMLWPLTAGRRVEKERHLVRLGDDLRGEVDLFAGSLHGFALVEVEFTDADAAAAFQPPPWFGPEVTDDDAFANRNLARTNGRDVSNGLQAALAPIAHSVGAIPVMNLNGEDRVVAVTTRSGSRWVFPKGNPEEDVPNEEMAVREALEEAGVNGEIFGEPIPVHYWKGYAHYIISYYPMRVTALLTDWEERKERDRRVCTREEARSLFRDRSIVDAVERVFARKKGGR